jgi:hypothetical protein
MSNIQNTSRFSRFALGHHHIVNFNGNVRKVCKRSQVRIANSNFTLKLTVKRSD